MKKSRSTKTTATRSAPARRLDDLRRWMHEGLQSLRPDAAILAIGCEAAYLAPHLTEYSENVTVLDTSAVELAQLAGRFPEIAFLHHDPSWDLPFDAAHFEAVWCCELLDRVFDPRDPLREMHRVLRPGGRLLVTVPDPGLRGMIDSLLGRESLHGATPRMHQFTRASLVRLARETGFLGAATDRGSRPHDGRSFPRHLFLSARKDSRESPRRGGLAGAALAGSRGAA